MQEAEQRRIQQRAPARSAGASVGVSAAAGAPLPLKARSLADLEAMVLAVVVDLVGEGVDVNEPLSSQGLDSLASMELRQKLQVLTTATNPGWKYRHVGR